MEKEKNEEAEKMDYKEVARNNFSVWNEILQTGNPQKISPLYEDGATFLPTVSPKFKKGREEAAGYFEHFMAKNPKGEIKSEEIQVLGDNVYLHSGLYDFELDGEEGRSIVEARFSYVWRRDNEGKWKIAHHHSSVKPK
ncbi:MAG: SgcJ/EcaC family oxidoreductase [Candidatus Moranbacteria bacterium]|nr:SgcJ/EcaC family oxidoreductase [Candidatus Moranbacteria bacterium]